MILPTRKFKNPRARHGFKGRTCSIISVGSYVPERVLSNGDLEKMVDTSDEWIYSRTGIKERRIAAQHEATSDLAAKAARVAMERAKVTTDQTTLASLLAPGYIFTANFFDRSGCVFGFYLCLGNCPAIHHVPHL